MTESWRRDADSFVVHPPVLVIGKPSVSCNSDSLQLTVGFSDMSVDCWKHAGGGVRDGMQIDTLCLQAIYAIVDPRIDFLPSA